MVEGSPNHRGRHHQFVMGGGKNVVLEPETPLPSSGCGGTHRVSLLEVLPGMEGGREGADGQGCVDFMVGVTIWLTGYRCKFRNLLGDSSGIASQNSYAHEAGKISELIHVPHETPYNGGSWAGTPAIVNGIGRRAGSIPLTPTGTPSDFPTMSSWAGRGGPRCLCSIVGKGLAG
jgi:hypothetical protein